MSTNISCLETFALNILKDSSPEKIASNINIPELDPCSLCNQELFLFEIKNPITILVCGHIYHRDCIETSIKKRSICPKPDCKKEVESTVDSMPGSQNINDLMDISPNLFNDPQLYSSSPKKRVSESTSKSSSKKMKKQVRKEDSPILKKLISELSTDTSKNAEILQSKFAPVTNTINFLNLYQKIIESEDINKKTSQDVILCYFHLGKALEDRFNHYRKTNPKRTAQGLVNNEVRTQIPESVSESLLRKTKERAQKIYDIFNEIGVDKIKRIRSFTATTIANISQDDIDFVLAKLSVIYADFKK
jgi:hypothetical protein